MTSGSIPARDGRGSREAGGRFYQTAVILAGTVVLCDALVRLAVDPPDMRWLLLATLTVMSGAAQLKMPGIAVNFSISDGFTMAAALLFGVPTGVVTVAIDALVISTRIGPNGLPLRRMLFNVAAPAVSMWIGAHAFFLLAGADPLRAASALPPERIIVPLGVFAAMYFFSNTGLIAVAIAWDRGESPVALWRRHFVDLWLTYFGGAAVAALLLVLANARQQAVLFAAIVLPVPFLLYATFRSVVGRMEDRVRHLDEVNHMQLATIETLAHAIDAKDQVTHGHIRRVQHLAVALARRLDVTDERELQALEAASLLHDIGKLAVPEFILNKPSSLTPGEFERMKQHARIGAEILSTVSFPFPVVPIVRHHHENWDGTGYPDGLKGDAIPFGARILAVADCFDALTSDRPYRPALSLEEATAILRERSGTMYEPRVVERFVEMSPALLDDRRMAGASEAFRSIARTVQTRERPTGEQPRRDEMRAMFELGRTIAGAADPEEALTRAHAALARLMPAATCALFVWDRSGENLVAAFVTGEHRDAVRGLTTACGQRLTGWVAANRQTIVNSDAALDLGNLIVGLQPTPQSCLSTPICLGSDLVGVLTVYSTLGGFQESDAAVVEVLAAGLAGVVGHHPKAAARRAPGSALRVVPGAGPRA